MDDFEFPEMPHVYLPAVNADDGLTRWEFLQGAFEVSRVLFLGICLEFHYFLGRVGFPKL